jgi:hypothetical protein
MDEHLIEKLRRGESLHKMQDGREGVSVTVQFQGTVPAVSRPERKEWLRQHFAQLGTKLAYLPIRLDPASVSVSGQTVEATCAVDCLPQLQQAVEHGGHKVEIVRTVQAVPE